CTNIDTIYFEHADVLCLGDGDVIVGDWQIGDAEDGDYSDGLFTDFTSGTPVGTAVDRFNEVLSSLAPSPPPALDGIDIGTNGNNGDLSFGASQSVTGYSNVIGIGSRPAADVDEDFNDSGDRAGIVNASTNTGGTVADNVAAGGAGDKPYPANAFPVGDGSAQGTLKLELNGAVVHTTDLDVFVGPGSDLTGSTGFSAISAATSVQFDNGDPFDVFKYRTASWIVDSSDMRNGWNYARVTHTIDGSDRNTNYTDWVVDDASNTTVYKSAALDALSMTGSAYLAGVRYHTGGTAEYDITISGAQVYTYQDGSIVSFTETRGSIPSQSLANVNGGTFNQDNTYTDLTFTVSTQRILDQSIATTTSCQRTFNALEAVSSSSSIAGLLMDPLIDDGNSSDTDEPLDDEDYRLASHLDLDDLNYSGGGGAGRPPLYAWNSTSGLIAGGTGFNDGLLQYNGTVRYPTQGVNSGDFRNTGDGGSIANGYAGNPDYSGATGDRVWLRYYYKVTNHQNFTLDIDGSSSTFVSVATGVSSNNITLEMLAPATTKNGGGTTEFKDCYVGYTTDDAIGCYATGSRATGTTNWVITLGTKSTSTSAGVIVLRITASASWTGNISDIDVNFD
ncbi:MAG: hypothetical protein ACXAEN_21900, partial [Candidatus Thorarchaeota archaeon]